MRRIFPYPLLTISLLAMWLLLQQSLGYGHILLGSIIAVLASLPVAALQPQRPSVRRPGKILRLAALVAIDVLRSNVAVALLVLQRRRRDRTSGFLIMPLELHDRTALAILACIITATPGSAWLEYNAAQGTVLIHVLDLVDEKQWMDTIKNRYESLLLEIFQ